MAARPVSDRIVPFDVEAEEAVLGSVLLDSLAIVHVASFLHPADFYREVNAWVFEAMLALYDRREALDYLTVRDEVERRGRLDAIGGAAYLTRCLNSVPTAVHIEHYGRIVERCAIRRRMIQAGEAVAMLGYDEVTATAVLLDKAEQVVQGIARVTSQAGFYAASDIVEAMQAEMWNETPATAPLSTGLSELDAMLGGLMPKELTVVAGRTGMGKTSFLDTLAYNLLQAGQGVAFVSLEMTKEAIMNRLRRMRTGIPAHRLRLPGRVLRQDELHRINEADSRLFEMPLAISETRGLTITQIRRLCRQWCARHPFKVLLVDYIQNIRADQFTGNRHGDLTEIMLGLYELAGELGKDGVHVIAASQLNRDTEKRGQDNTKPQLSDLRESGKIEETANNVIGLWRPDYYSPPATSTKPTTPAPALPSKAIILKQREGRTGEVDLGWWGERSMFINLSDVSGLRRTA